MRVDGKGLDLTGGGRNMPRKVDWFGEALQKDARLVASRENWWAGCREKTTHGFAESG